MLLALMLLLMPRDVVIATFGPKWLPAVPTARLLAPYAAALPIFSNMIQLMYGRGMMRQAVTLRAAQVAVFVPGVLIATRAGGTKGAAVALLAAMVVGIALVAWFQRSLVQLAGREIFLPPAIACLVAVAVAIPAALVGTVMLGVS